MTTGHLHANGITKTIKNAQLLNGVSLSCAAGRAVALVGPNGAGKTLLLKALSLVDPPTSGTIDIEGVRLTFPQMETGNPPPPWPNLTFVFQQLFLWPHLTVRQNILLPVEVERREALESSNLRFQNLVEELGIQDVVKRYPNQISGGQRQRAALARALMLRPKWLLLDEPNSALDVEQNSLLQALLLRKKAEGLGIIFSSHLLGFAAAVADQVIFMDHGEIVEEGGIQILVKPKTDRLLRFISMVELSPRPEIVGNEPSQ